MNKKKAVPVSYKDPLAVLKGKFSRLKEIRAELQKAKALYQEHDLLMEELMPLFIEVHPDKFVTKREVTLGTDKYRIVPHFFDEKKGQVLSKQWKSSCFPTVTVE